MFCIQPIQRPDPEPQICHGPQLVRPTRGLQLLEAFAAEGQDGHDAFWRCFEGRLEVWEGTFKEAEGQRLAECNLARLADG